MTRCCASATATRKICFADNFCHSACRYGGARDYYDIMGVLIYDVCGAIEEQGDATRLV